MSKAIGLTFPADEEWAKDEIDKRAVKMNISASKYCRMILIRHLKSGESFTVSDK